jgi:hypothetical protein
VNTRPYFTGRYDPVACYRNNVVEDLVVSERGNAGVCFTTPVGAEEHVTALVYVNDYTTKSAATDARAILNGGAVDTELRVMIRGSMLEGLGSIGEFHGISSRMEPDAYAAALALIQRVNPRVADLIERHKAGVAVWVGDEVHLIDSIVLPLKEVPGAVVDLAAANNSKGNQHAGALRVAETLEVACRMLEKAGRIPQGTMPAEVLAVNRWKTKAGQEAVAKSRRESAADDIDGTLW